MQRNSPHKLNISHSLKDLPPKVIFNPLIFLCCCKCAQYFHNIYYWLCLESNNVLFLSSLHSCLVSFKLILILGIIHKGRWEVGAVRVTLTAEVTKCWVCSTLIISPLLLRRAGELLEQIQSSMWTECTVMCGGERFGEKKWHCSWQRITSTLWNACNHNCDCSTLVPSDAFECQPTSLVYVDVLHFLFTIGQVCQMQFSLAACLNNPT